MKFPPRRESAQGGGGSNYLKLAKSGDSIKGVFRGDLATREVHWIAKKPVPCTGAKCEHCKAGDYPKFRFSLNFVINENGAYTAKIFEQGRTVCDQLASLHEDYDLEETVVRITRQGEGTDTSYNIVPLPPKEQLSAEAKKKIAAVALHNLGGGEQAEPGADADESDTPF